MRQFALAISPRVKDHRLDTFIKQDYRHVSSSSIKTYVSTLTLYRYTAGPKCLCILGRCRTDRDSNGPRACVSTVRRHMRDPCTERPHILISHKLLMREQLLIESRIPVQFNLGCLGHTRSKILGWQRLLAVPI